jgi:DUF4097 and DUF4098 domain-containing protein YvlB
MTNEINSDKNHVISHGCKHLKNTSLILALWSQKTTIWQWLTIVLEITMKRRLGLFLLVSVITTILACCMGMGRLVKERYERIEQVSSPTAGIEELSVDTSYGDIKIKGADTNDCNVSARITAQAPNTDEAKSLAEQTKITLAPEGKILFIRAQKPEIKKSSSIAVSYTIIVPKNIGLECKSSYGNIRLANTIGDVTANTSYGDIVVENISGKLRLNTSYGKVDCKQIICTYFSANSSFGDVFAVFSNACPNDINIKIATSYGDIDADVPLDFTGDVSVDTSFGKIKTDIPIVIKGELNKSHITGTVGQGGKGVLELKTSFGSVKIE